MRGIGRSVRMTSSATVMASPPPSQRPISVNRAMLRSLTLRSRNPRVRDDRKRNPSARSGWVGPAHRRSTVERARSERGTLRETMRRNGGVPASTAVVSRKATATRSFSNRVETSTTKRPGSRSLACRNDAGPRHESDPERDDSLEIAGLHDVGDVRQIKGTPSGAKGRREVGRRTVRGDAVQDDLEVGIAVNVGCQS